MGMFTAELDWAKAVFSLVSSTIYAACGFGKSRRQIECWAVWRWPGPDHATPECRAKLILTENPTILFSQIFTVHSKKKKCKERKEKALQPFTSFPVRLPAASMERLSFLRAYFHGIRQGRGKIERVMRSCQAQNLPSLRRL